MSRSAAAPMFREFPDSRAMFATLAEQIATRLRSAVGREGRASFVGSGGRTPGDLYDLLSKRDASWADVVVSMSDERWVEPTSDRSNEKLLRTRLLVGEAAKARLVPLKTDKANARDAEGEVHAAIAAMPRPFSVTLLGMGTDGHTASLIPGASGLARALDKHDPMLARAVFPPRLSEMGERMTLTLRALLESRLIVLLITGEDKLKAYRDAAAGDDVLAAPVRAVLHQSAAPVEVFWSP